MVCTRKKKHQNKKLVNRLNDSLFDFVIDKLPVKDFVINNFTKAEVAGNETVETQSGSLVDSCGLSTASENNTSHDQLLERSKANRIGKSLTTLLRPSKVGFMRPF